MWMYRGGLKLLVDPPSVARGLWLTANDDADWRIELRQGDRALATVLRAGDDASPGVIRRTCLPLPAESAGFDRLHFQGTRGSQACFGGIELVDACPP